MAGRNLLKAFASNKGQLLAFFRSAKVDAEKVCILLLVFITYLACFSLASQVGIYEDDYLHVQHWGKDWDRVLFRLERVWEVWSQGRPVAGTLSVFIIYASELLGRLIALQTWSFFLLSINAVFVFLILKRVTPLPAAFVGALMMIVYPGDAAKMEIIRAIQLQPTMLLFLSATLMYLKGYRILPYLFVGLSLFIYENVALLFFLVPLLRLPIRSDVVRPLLTNAFLLTGVILCVILLRTQFGPGDLAGVGADVKGFNPIERSLISTVLGFLVNFKLLVIRPATALAELTIPVLVVVSMVGVGAFVFLQSRMMPRIQVPSAISSASFNPMKWSAPSQLILVGILMILAAYPLMITFDRFAPILELGRRTSCHTAASFGTSILTAAVFWQASHWKRMRLSPKLLHGVFALYLALLAGFQVAVQQGMATGWGFQKAFWQSVLVEVPDLEKGDLIIVEGQERLPETPYIRSYGFYSNLVLPLIFDFGNLRSAATARLIWSDQVSGKTGYFPAELSADDDLTIQVPFEPRPRTQMNGKVIWLSVGQDGIRRQFGNKKIGGISVRLKPRGEVESQANLKKGVLYDYLLN